MATFSNSDAGDLLILDTGPIREIVSYYAVEYLRFDKLRSDLRCFFSHDAYEKCGRFIQSFRHKITSPSVVAELHYWIRETDRGGRIRLWRIVHEQFQMMGMDEQVVKFLEMDVETVTRHGPVDVSLLMLAQRNSGNKPHILTIENKLAAECNRARIRSSVLHEVVA